MSKTDNHTRKSRRSSQLLEEYFHSKTGQSRQARANRSGKRVAISEQLNVMLGYDELAVRKHEQLVGEAIDESNYWLEYNAEAERDGHEYYCEICGDYVLSWLHEGHSDEEWKKHFEVLAEYWH